MTAAAQPIDAFLERAPTRSKSLLMTIFGDAIAPHGGVAWLGSLVELLAPLGLSERLVRTSLARLAADGWLGARRHGRRSAYALTPAALPQVENACRRIYAPNVPEWDGGWTMVVATGCAVDAPLRAPLRKALSAQGYKMAGPGVFVHPAGDMGLLAELGERLGVAGQLHACRAGQWPGAHGRALAALGEHGWDLARVMRSYECFNERFRLLPAALRRAGQVAPQQAFAIRAGLIHAYRRAQWHDPRLPGALLPDPWPGSAAYALVRESYLLLRAQSERFIVATLGPAPGANAANVAGAAVCARFGGLTEGQAGCRIQLTSLAGAPHN